MADQLTPGDIEWMEAMADEYESLIQRWKDARPYSQEVANLGATFKARERVIGQRVEGGLFRRVLATLAAHGVDLPVRAATIDEANTALAIARTREEKLAACELLAASARAEVHRLRIAGVKTCPGCKETAPNCACVSDGVMGTPSNDQQKGGA